MQPYTKDIHQSWLISQYYLNKTSPVTNNTLPSQSTIEAEQKYLSKQHPTTRLEDWASRNTPSPPRNTDSSLAPRTPLARPTTPLLLRTPARPPSALVENRYTLDKKLK